MAAAVALSAAPAFLARYPQSSGAALPRGALRGAYHVHSTASDGRGTLEQIAQAARATGLQFVVMTDHNLDAVPRPRYQDGVLMIFGTELSTPWGHLVALEVPRGLNEAERNGDPVGRVRSAQGVAVVAHPVQAKNPWRDAQAAERAQGFELYSGDSLWREALRHPFSRLIPALAALPLRPQHAMQMVAARQPEAAAELMVLSERTPKAALCAHDAHGFPSYETMFGAMALYLPVPEGAGLPKDAEAAARWVVASLAAGSAHCAFRALGEPEGFGVTGMAEDRREAQVGERLKVRMPAQVPFSARLAVSGAGVLEPDGFTVQLNRPGPVQIEVWALGPGPWGSPEWKPWISSSTIHVSPAAAR